MASMNCECGHEKRDHRQPPLGTHSYGECKVCLCNRYTKIKAPVVHSEAK